MRIFPWPIQVSQLFCLKYSEWRAKPMCTSIQIYKLVYDYLRLLKVVFEIVLNAIRERLIYLFNKNDSLFRGLPLQIEATNAWNDRWTSTFWYFHRNGTEWFILCPKNKWSKYIKLTKLFWTSLKTLPFWIVDFICIQIRLMFYESRKNLHFFR